MNLRSAMIGSQSSTNVLNKNVRLPGRQLLNSNKQNVNLFRNNQENEHLGYRSGQHTRRPIFQQQKPQQQNSNSKLCLGGQKGDQFRPASAEVRMISPKNLHYYVPKMSGHSTGDETKSNNSIKKSVRFSQNSIQLTQQQKTAKQYKTKQVQPREPTRNRSNSILKNKNYSQKHFDIKCQTLKSRELTSSTIFSISQYKNTLVRERFNQLFKCMTKNQDYSRKFLHQRCISSKQLSPNQKNHYIDPNFLTVDSSIFKTKPTQPLKIKWMRISELFKQKIPVIMTDSQSNVTISKQPNTFANFHFVSLLNLIRSSRALLYKMFQNAVYNEAGIYMVKIFVDHEWKCVIIDDFVPVFEKNQQNGTMVFTNIRELQSSHPEEVIEIWPLLLEKAYASVLGSYQAVHEGENIFSFCQLMGLPVQKVKITPDELSWLQQLKEINKESLIFCYSPPKKDPKEDHSPYRLKSLIKPDPKSKSSQLIHFQQLSTKLTVKMQLPHFAKSFDEMFIIKISTLEHFTAMNILISGRYRARTNLMLGINDSQSAGKVEKQIRREKPIVKCFLLGEHEQISVVLKRKAQNANKQWFRVFLFMKELDSYRWIEGKYSCQTVSFSSAVEPGQYYLVILPDWTTEGQSQLTLMLYSRVTPIILQNYSQSKADSMIEKGCCDYVQRYGKMIQVNRWICTYAMVDRECGIVIENINNQRRNGRVKIYRSIANLKPTGCSLLPLNDDFYSNGQLKPEVELSLQKEQSYSVILLLFGGSDDTFLNTFNFGV